MRHYLILCLVALVTSQISWSFPNNLPPQVTKRPVIGILTQPDAQDNYDQTNYPENSWQYISAQYVKWFETAGATVVYLKYDDSEENNYKIYKSLNALFFPGGGSSVVDREAGFPYPPSKMTQMAKYLLELAIKDNENGDFFPVMGTCQGHLMIHYILNGYEKYSTEVYTNSLTNKPQSIKIIDNEAFVYRNMDEEILKDIQDKSILHFDTGHVVEEISYNQALHQYLKVISTSQGLDSEKTQITFVAATQGKNLPIFTQQYHPEVSGFAFQRNANHNKVGINAMLSIANTFVSMARRNSRVATAEVLNLNLANENAIYTMSHIIYDSTFYFKNSQTSSQ